MTPDMTPTDTTKFPPEWFVDPARPDDAPAKQPDYVEGLLVDRDSGETVGIVGAVIEPEVIDGYLVDPITGEVLGHQLLGQAEELVAGYPGVLDGRLEVNSDEAAEWVLERRAEAEAGMLAIDAQQRAIVARLDANRNRLRRRVEWLDARFGAGMQAYVQAKLDAMPGGKRRPRSVNFAHGTVGFRSAPGSIRITDPAKAVDYVAEWAPDEVKRSVGVTGFKAAIAADERANESPRDVSEFATVTGPEDRFYISTGLGKGGA